jgi:hypothetical protein
MKDSTRRRLETFGILATRRSSLGERVIAALVITPLVVGASLLTEALELGHIASLALVVVTAFVASLGMEAFWRRRNPPGRSG